MKVRFDLPLGAVLPAFASGLGFGINQGAKTFVCRSSSEPNPGVVTAVVVDRNLGDGGAFRSIPTALHAQAVGSAATEYPSASDEPPGAHAVASVRTSRAAAVNGASQNRMEVAQPGWRARPASNRAALTFGEGRRGRNPRRVFSSS